MRFGSVCSGIEAASVAWNSLGWTAAWFSEIEPFPCAVLAHHFPTVPNYGDMSLLPERILSGEIEAPDILCGGTPCQAFSVAGSRRSLGDERGNLTLKFIEVADAIDTVRTSAGKPPAIIFWENVPGVLRVADNAFGCLLAGLSGEDAPLEIEGGRWGGSGIVRGGLRSIAWRVLDAQFFGVPQRRRRLYLIASARAGFSPAEVLFERKGLSGNFAESGGKGEASPGGTGVRAAEECYDMTHPCDVIRECGDKTPTLKARMGTGGNQIPIICSVYENQRGSLILSDRVNSVTCGGGKPGQGYPAALAGDAAERRVRKLTPTECERLQGFPDNWTRIPYRGRDAENCPDSPRYRAIGNSWAVPVVRWIGRRIGEALK